MLDKIRQRLSLTRREGEEPRAPRAPPATFKKVEPTSEPVNGVELLDELSTWLTKYIYLPPGAADTIAVWTVATWLVDYIYIAPILALLSPTKRSGKTLVLDLLARIVRRPASTSGMGVTSAVVFRLNHAEHPTFLIDEAEFLSRQREARDIIGLLNTGYRRGTYVQRCADNARGGYDVRKYDAFGFRAIAAIGTLWDTLLDRAIIIQTQRKPRSANLARFDSRIVDEDGDALARRIARFVDDIAENYHTAGEQAPRPDWLNDRECDNWQCLFAVAELAGGDWPERIQEAARELRAQPGEDGDPGEQLLRDVHQIFADRGFPAVINSTDLAKSLSDIETSPWGAWYGKRLNPHRLARLFKPFGIKPRQQRTTDGKSIRGYWLIDLKPVFERFCPPEKVVQAVQANEAVGEVVEHTAPVPVVTHIPLSVVEGDWEAVGRG
ncbi:MAG: DUF3631 domain-containing protein [Candidatus Binatia bacterium]